jgi:hypothetical protein
MALEQIANSAASTLSAAIVSTSATTFTVANGTVFPSVGNFRVIIDSEIMICTSRSGNTLTVTRGQEGTTAATHLNAAPVTHVLTAGGISQWVKENALALVPAARVYHSTNQSIANNTGVALAFNTESFDTDTIHDTVTNNSRLTCKTAGKYLITGTIEWAANATGIRQAILQVNGTTQPGIDERIGTATYPVTTTVVTLYDLAVNDYVELLGYQDSGGALNALTDGIRAPVFEMVRVA